MSELTKIELSLGAVTAWVYWATGNWFILVSVPTIMIIFWAVSRKRVTAAVRQFTDTERPQVRIPVDDCAEPYRSDTEEHTVQIDPEPSPSKHWADVKDLDAPPCSWEYKEHF